MSENEIKDTDEGMELARRMAEEEEGIGRRPKGPGKYVIPTICVFWSVYQLSIASWLIMDSTFIRAIHLGFALLIVYLNYPLLKKPIAGLSYFAAKDRIPILDYLIGIVAAFAALYIAIDYAGMSARYGAPITRDIVIGAILVITLLEASRRVIGPALPIIAIDNLCVEYRTAEKHFAQPLHGPDDHVHRRHLRHPAGCVRNDCFLVCAVRRHAGQGRRRPIFYPAGLEPAGRI